jgi:TetR/AcrR family transcriptional regulator, copper-responsive repressor
MAQKSAGKRGRPRSFDTDKVIGQALDAFWDGGYAGTSLDDISAATGLNRPSLYNAFGGKRAIYAMALERYSVDYRDRMVAALDYRRPLREAMTRAFDAAIAIYLSGRKPRGCFLLATALTEAPFDREVRSAMAGGLHELESRFEKRISHAKHRGELPDAADPTILAKLASATIYSLAIWARTGEGRPALRRIAEAVVDLICGPASRG